MNTKKIFTSLAIVAFAITSTFAATGTFNNSNVSGTSGDSKDIKLLSDIPAEDVSITLKYAASELTDDITGFDISQTQSTQVFTIHFSSRLNTTQDFSITIAPGEFMGTVDNEDAGSSVTPYIINARSDSAAPSPAVGTYTTFDSLTATFTTALYPGLNSDISGANFKLKWDGNASVPSGTWTSTNVITVSAI